MKLFRRGKTRVFFVASISNKAAPTAAEVNAGTEVTSMVNDITGFSAATGLIPTPTLDTTFTGSIGGEQTAADSGLTLYLDDTSNPLRTTLAMGTTGFIVWLDNKVGTIVATDKVDVYPIQVISTPKKREMGNVPAVWDAMMAITSLPVEDVALA